MCATIFIAAYMLGK